MIEKRKNNIKIREWPIKSDAYPSMRISKKKSGWSYCAYCDQKIVEGDIAYVIYPKLATSNLWLHINCLDGLYKELTGLRKKNIQKIICEQICQKIPDNTIQ